MSKSNREFMCTCLLEDGKKDYNQKHLKFHPTEVDEEECCVHCGYYAWEKPMHVIYPRTNQVPWRTEVAQNNHGNVWAGMSEMRRGYYEKTYYSDWEVDNGSAFDIKEFIKSTDMEQELSQLYVRRGGSNREKSI
jgi:hypothetical protein